MKKERVAEKGKSGGESPTSLWRSLPRIGGVVFLPFSD
jgi:hypothetical protein